MNAARASKDVSLENQTESEFSFSGIPPWLFRVPYEELFKLDNWDEKVDFDRLLGYTEELEAYRYRRPTVNTMNDIAFIALDELIQGKTPSPKIGRELVDSRLAEQSTTGCYQPTQLGYQSWREYRVVPGRITPAQATLMVAHWRKFFAISTKSWAAYIQRFQTNLREMKPQLTWMSVNRDLLLLEEADARASWGNEAFGPYTMWA